MASAFVFLLLFLLAIPANTQTLVQSNDLGFISLVISEKGLDFVKDLLIKEALSSLTPLHLPDIKKSVKIPIIGRVHVSFSNITLSAINVSSSHIATGETGVAIVASGATADMGMDWRYSYSTWLVPIEISDKGRAFIKVEGMEIGITLTMENQNGSLKLSSLECGCYLKDISITLDGGASWLYQGFVDAFEGQIRSSVENVITKKVEEGVVKLDTLLQNLPKEIKVDDITAVNVTFTNNPLLCNSSVGFEINGLFTAANKVANPNYLLMNSQSYVSCNGPFKMLWISLDEAVFRSASDIYFKAGIMHWIVDKVPDQSLLNTASWKYLVPQMYKKYPNDDMQLNISLTSPPVIQITPYKIDAAVVLDMIIEVLDENETLPVACISMDISTSIFPEISGNNIAGQARLDDFTLSLKWSKVGNFHMYLIQTVVRVFLKDVAAPFVNSHLRKGFPLPIIHGFSLQDAEIACTDSRIWVYSDARFNESSVVKQPTRYQS